MKSIIYLAVIYLCFACSTKYQEKVSEEGVAYLKPNVFIQDGKEYYAYIVGIDAERVSKKDFKNRQEIRITPEKHTIKIACKYEKITNTGNFIALLDIAQGRWWNAIFLDNNEEAFSLITFTAKPNTTYDVNCQHTKYSWIEETESKRLIAESKDKPDEL